MANPLSRLLLRTRPASRRDQSRSVDGVMAMAGGAIALEDAEAGPPPVLLPAAIFRQLLFDPTELTPAWLRPRPAPVPAAAGAAGPTIDATAPDVPPTDVPKAAKRTRRPKSDGTASPSRPRSRRVAKQDPAADDL